MENTAAFEDAECGAVESGRNTGNLLPDAQHYIPEETDLHIHHLEKPQISLHFFSTIFLSFFFIPTLFCTYKFIILDMSLG
jgi:hypothetical protein